MGQMISPCCRRQVSALPIMPSPPWRPPRMRASTIATSARCFMRRAIGAANSRNRHHLDDGRRNDDGKQDRQKNKIIGTVSFGGGECAFFSAMVIRISRLSCATTRNAVPRGRPIFLRLDEDGRDLLDRVDASTRTKVFQTPGDDPADASSAVASVNSSASGTDCTPISWLTLRKACSIDMPDSTQIRRSMASGKDLRIDVWRLLIVFFRKSSGALI